MPSARADAGSMCGTVRPPTASVPESAVSAPVMILISVDFPAPFSPTTACTSPGRSSKVTPFSACTPANDFVIDAASRRLSTEGSYPKGGTRPESNRAARRDRRVEWLLCVPGGRGGCFPLRSCVRDLEHQSESELHVPAVVGARDHAGRRVRDVRVWIAEIHVVQDVEDLRAEF